MWHFLMNIIFMSDKNLKGLKHKETFENWIFASKKAFIFLKQSENQFYC